MRSPNRVGRLTVLIVGIGVLFTGLACRLVVVQVLDHEVWLRKARARYTGTETLEGPRGKIVDRNGDLLARNQTVYNLVIDMKQITEVGITSAGIGRKEGLKAAEVRKKYTREQLSDMYRDYLVESLSDPLRFPKWDLAKRLGETRGELILARGIEEDFYRELTSLFSSSRIGGVHLRKGEKRFYPSPYTLSHVIGFVNAEGRGMEGIEKTFDAEMTGAKGERKVERTGSRGEIHAFRGEELPPNPGKNVHLTIDMGLQAEAERVIDKIVAEHQPKRVCTIWMRPSTGEILALANRPHFDLSTREGERANVAVSEIYEPGSTFKVVGAAAVMDSGMVDLNTRIDCETNGVYDDGGIHITDDSPHGWLPFGDVLAKSSNIGMFKAVRQMKPEDFLGYIERFGFGTKTGVLLSGESSGVFHQEDLNITSVPSMSYGYAIGVTPLQMITAVAAIANGGSLMRPMIVKSLSDETGKTVKTFEPEVVRQVIKPQTAVRVRDAMMRVVSPGGTGAKGAVDGFHVAGKTGTARRVSDDGSHYEAGHYVVSFVGFFPAENPELVGLVVVGDPKGNGVKLYGGTIAAPAFAEIGKAAVRTLAMTPTEPTQLAETVAEEKGVVSGR